MLGKRWQQIKVQIVQRPVPHTVMSWRFLLPGQSRAVDLHRRVFLAAWPRLPRWVWGMIVLYASARWFTYQCWGQIGRAVNTHGHPTWERFGIPLRTQLLDVVRLAIGHSIPPRFYYQYALFHQPRNQWLQYIYTHELPHWHAVMSPRLGPRTHHLLSRKHDFAVTLASHGLPTVETVHFLARGQAVASAKLFSKRSYFCKPNQGSRSAGCFALRYDPAQDTYRLRAEESLDDPTAIDDYVSRQVAKQDYLLQPLLTNHPCLQRQCQTAELVTLRVVTGLDRHWPVLIYATLEIPQYDSPDAWWLIPVDCHTGQCLDHPVTHLPKFKERQAVVHRLRAMPLPFWSQTAAMCRQAHQYCPDLLTIGWDVAMTPSGPALLEGNINWRLAEHQILSAEPALSGRLGRLYQQGSCGST